MGYSLRCRTRPASGPATRSTRRIQCDRPLLLGILVCCIWLAGGATLGEIRTWSGATGDSKIEGELFEVKGSSVVIRLKNGDRTTIPLQMLSAADQAYVRGQQSPDAAAEEPVAEEPPLAEQSPPEEPESPPKTPEPEDLGPFHTSFQVHGTSHHDLTRLTGQGVYAKVSGHPGISPQGMLAWRPLNGHQGTGQLVYTVTDGADVKTYRFTLHVGHSAPHPIKGAKQPQPLSAVEKLFSTSFQVDNESTHDLTALTGKGTYVNVSGHGNLSQDGTFKWKPTRGHVGRQQFIYKVIDGTDVKTYQLTLLVEQGAPHPVVGSGAPGDTTVAEGELSILLEEPYDSFCTGGNGRYIIFQLKKSKKLALFDTFQKRIAGEINVPADDFHFAAGFEKLMVVLPGQKLIQRWDIKTLQREKTVPAPQGIDVKRLLMGHASAGPLLLWERAKGVLFDIDKMQPLKIRGDMLTGHSKHGLNITVSADGQTFIGWVDTGSGGAYALMRIEGNRTSIIKGQGGIYGQHQIQPNPDAAIIYTNNGSVFDRNLKPLPANWLKSTMLIPTEDPRWFISVRGRGGSEAEVSFCTASDRQVVHSIKGLEEMPVPRYGSSLGRSDEPRVRFVPSAKLLITLPPSNDKLVLRPMDLIGRIEESGKDFLFVTSVPETQTSTGSRYSYQITAESNAGGVKYKLESGPEGMTLSDSGQLRWKVTRRPIGGIAKVIVALSDASGKEAFHSFDIAVVRPSVLATAPPKPPAAAPGKDAPGKDQPRQPPAGPERSPGGDLVKVDPSRLEIPDGAFDIVPGLQYRTLLLLQGDKLVVLGGDGVTINSNSRLPKSYAVIAERRDYYVACANEPKVLDLVDKKTLAVKKSFRFSHHGVTDLALHPTRPYSYVAFKAGFSVPRYRFIVYNEQTGEGRESDDLVGKWLEVDPKGEFLIAGYSDIYEKGSRLLVNPRHVHVVPEYGSIDWLIRYELPRDAMPVQDEVKEKAGGNGKGIRMSRDAKRVTYLSHVGYPKFSGNLAGWDPADLEKMSVTYATKDKGTTYDLAYHPVVPLVASPGSGSAVFFHRETGEIQQDRLKLPDGGLAGENCKLHRVYFSPDGRNLLFDTSINEIHYLRKVELRLSPEELRLIDADLEKRGTSPPPDGPKPLLVKKVPLRAFDSLKGGRGRTMSPKEIARWFTCSVVVIRHSKGSGTGFVVGRDGYILTCAHVLPRTGNPTVVYRDTAGGRTTTKTTSAEIVQLSEKKDLALLKVRTSKPLRSIRFDLSGTVEAGERVAVIGNPGVGSRILDYSITEGIVSSPRRELLGQTLIQTSATINPGSSGGPMFNDRGLVIGLVVLKADIEATGFAVPVDQLVTFILAGAKATGADMTIERVWTDSTGKHQIEALYGGLVGGKVRLKKTDGRIVQLPLERLSPADQGFVRQVSRVAE